MVTDDPQCKSGDERQAQCDEILKRILTELDKKPAETRAATR